MFDGWITWDNVFYVLFLIATALLTIVSAKWRATVKEMSELFHAIKDANEDGKITEEEKQAIVREALQAGYALLRAVWFIKVPVK